MRHPQTSGKLERLRGEIQRKLPEFEAIMQRTGDLRWYNHDRPHMSPNDDTPVQAFAKKMPPKGTTVIDGQSGEMYDVR